MRFKIGVPWKLHFKNYYYYLWIGDAMLPYQTSSSQCHIPLGLDENIFVSSIFLSCISIFIHQDFFLFCIIKKVLWPVSFRSTEDFGPFFPFWYVPLEASKVLWIIIIEHLHARMSFRGELFHVSSQEFFSFIRTPLVGWWNGLQGLLITTVVNELLLINFCRTTNVHWPSFYDRQQTQWLWMNVKQIIANDTLQPKKKGWFI